MRRSHLEFGVDAYLTSADYIARMGAIPGDTRLHSVLGPHQNREMSMMLAGVKPCALIEPHRERWWRPVAVRQGWHAARINCCDGENEHPVYALPGHAWRIEALRRIYARCASRMFDPAAAQVMTDADHARIGWLLGYSKTVVRGFLRRGDPLMAAMLRAELPERTKVAAVPG